MTKGTLCRLFRRQLTFLAVSGLFLGCNGGGVVEPLLSATAETAPVSLEGGARVQRRLAAPEIHQFRIQAEVGDYFEAVIAQEGIDLAVTLYAPQGRQVLTMDSPTGPTGQEIIRHAIEETGGYLLQIRSVDPVGQGAYQVHLESLRPATGADRQAAAAFAQLVLGDEIRRQGSLLEVLAAYNKSLDLLGDLQDLDMELHIRVRQGDLYARLEKYEEAATSIKVAIALARQRDMVPMEARLMSQLGALQGSMGRYDEAISAYSRVIDLQNTIGDVSSVAFSFNNLGVLASERGDYRRAREYLERALELRYLSDAPRELAQTLGNLAAVDASTGRRSSALARLQEARELYLTANDPRGIARTLMQLGAIFRRMGDLDRSLQVLRDSLARFRELGIREDEATVLNTLGEVYLDRGRESLAQDALEAAMAIFEGINNSSMRANTLILLGEVYLRKRSLEEAEAFFRNASILRRDQNSEREPAIQYGLARVERMRGDLDAARVRIEAALELAEIKRRRLVAAAADTELLLSDRHLYEFYIDLLFELQTQNPSQRLAAMALTASERSRVASITEPTGENRIDPKFLARNRELRQHLDAFDTSRLTEGDRGGDAEDGLQQAVRAYRQAKSEMRAELGSQEMEPPPIEDVQDKLLDKDTVVLEYFLGEARSFQWIVAKDTLVFEVLPSRARIEELAQRFYRLVAITPARSSPNELLLQMSPSLCSALLGPAANQLKARRLVVITDGALSYVPFAALPRCHRGDESRLLVEDFEIVQADSLTSIWRMRNRVAPRGKPPLEIAVLADPIYQADDPRLEEVGQALEGSPWPRLMGTQQEAEMILALVSEGRGLAALGAEANVELALSGQLSMYRILHLATHSRTDHEYPELSALVLSAFDQRGQPRPMLLRAAEIEDLDVPAELVVLAGSETALGPGLRGRGMSSLSQAFLSAGAKHVVGSLWCVSDMATAEFMARFYRALLQKGLPPPAALREAQLEFLKREQWSSPQFWAGFVMEGDWN